MSIPTPPFASWLRNAQASADNPQRDGMFVKAVSIRPGQMNPGIWFEMTDGHGHFWRIRPANAEWIEAPNPVAPAEASGRPSRGRSDG